ncbi:hypothetical protein NSS64_29500 [Paenibacillus sp. FSL H8-0122]|uniref:hypothetical protein n=1 Tax=Paenibacillus sp. FSL H8-0122 TaxID=2954510 RepID=UPI0030FC03A2
MLKNSGFYKQRFFITPEEFKRVVELLEPTQVRYYLTNYTHTEHDQNQVVEAYRAFYQYYTAAEKESGVRPFFIYSISVLPDTESFGFFARNEGISIPYHGQWAENELPCILISCPKGHRVNAQDEQGEYYLYEDVREHKPLSYALYKEITGSIQKITKPLRFSAQDTEAMDEQKPSVRISRDAAQDLSDSWMVRQYGLLIHGQPGPS